MFLVDLDKLGGAQPIGHVEANINLTTKKHNGGILIDKENSSNSDELTFT